MAFAAKSGTLVIGLYDGNIYFLDVYEKAETVNSAKGQKLTDYYQPVIFGRQEGENNVTLFFYDLQAQYLIPVTRTVKGSHSLLRDSIQELIRGPAQGSDLLRTIPKDTEVKVEVDNGIVEVALSEQLNQMSGSTFLTGVLKSLLLTVSSIPSVEQIQFTIAGEARGSFGQEASTLPSRFHPNPLLKKAVKGCSFYPAPPEVNITCGLRP